MAKVQAGKPLEWSFWDWLLGTGGEAGAGGKG